MCWSCKWWVWIRFQRRVCETFLQGVLKKLSNEKFVNNAPAAVIELERKKQADAESIIKSLKESIAALKKA